MQELYDKVLSNEWIDWVETYNPQGTREQEIFPYIQKWLKEFKPEIIADIGCGQGACSKLFDKTQYIGIEQSSILIERAKKLYSSSSNRTFIKGDAYKIPLKKESVDAIMSIWVWSHLKNLNLASEQMYKILKPNGKFLIITANPETYDERKTFYTKYSIKGNLLTGNFNFGNGKTLTNTTLYLHSTKQMEDAIKHAGFNISRIKKMGQAETSDKGLYMVIEGSK
jgi:ubiquinone/menaquinone biosynthesis C-methylase UbiE